MSVADILSFIVNFFTTIWSLISNSFDILNSFLSLFFDFFGILLPADVQSLIAFVFAFGLVMALIRLVKEIFS